jgi:hypothetical protein
MKIIFFYSIIFLFTISFVGCQSNSTISTTKQNATISNLNQTNIVGKWQWAASANDDNKNGIADATEWKYKNAAKEKEFADMKISMDDLTLHFNANGTGYTGKEENTDTKFTWTANNTNTNFTTQNIGDKSKSEFYFDNQGNLVQRDTGEMMAIGQKMKQTTFEMFKKNNTKL